MRAVHLSLCAVHVCVHVGDMGIAKDGSHKSTFTPGVDLMAGLTLFGEGCRGSLSQVRYRQCESE